MFNSENTSISSEFCVIFEEVYI